MFNSRPSSLPKAPPWAKARQAPDQELPPVSGQWGNGYTPDEVLKLHPIHSQAQPLQQQPQAPAAPARSDNPWAKENRSRTLLDIGAAFLSNQDFGAGMGDAAKAIGRRQDSLRAANQKSISYGGPDNQFEITVGPDGQRVIRQVPEFAQAVEAKRMASKALGPKDSVDLRARLVHGISQLPEAERPTAYRDLMLNPDQYGIDTKGMPTVWSENYGAVMGNMGQTVGQAEAQALRGRQFQHRQTVDERRLGQGDQRLQQGGIRIQQGERRLKSGGRSSGGSKANYGSDLDY